MGPTFHDEALQADEEEGKEEDENGQGRHKAPVADSCKDGHKGWRVHSICMPEVLPVGRLQLL